MHRRAFTLIELLVVISIIALLSSVVLASLNSAREKGRIAAGKQFAAGLEHAAGDEALGIWDFDECSGTSVADRSGFSHNGTFSGAVAWSSSVTPFSTGCSIQLGSGRYVNLSYASMPTGAAPRTVSAWIYMNSLTAGENNFLEWGSSGVANIFGLFVAAGNNKWAIHIGGTDLNSSVQVGLGSWNHLAATYDGSVARLYLNGSLIHSATVALNTGATGFFFGRHIGGTYTNFDGYLDGVRVYGKALTASEVGRLYAEAASAKSLAHE